MSSFNDPSESDLMQSVKLRGQVHRLVDKDLVRAYITAKMIRHPWYRCQSLANVAEYVERGRLETILRESFDSAMLCHDENRRVSVSCWPLAVALKRGEREMAASFLAQIKSQIESDKDIISRWCATSVLHTIKTDTGMLDSFFSTFLYATSQGHGWKVERSIRSIINDADIQKDQRYIDHLLNRQAEIEQWKSEHRACKST
jgi:hypothetical protein